MQSPAAAIANGRGAEVHMADDELAPSHVNNPIPPGCGRLGLQPAAQSLSSSPAWQLHVGRCQLMQRAPPTGSFGAPPQEWDSTRCSCTPEARPALAPTSPRTLAVHPCPHARSGMHQWKSCFLAHERLAIIDPASGDQPLYNEDKSIVVAVNGEIYNYQALKAQIVAAHPDKKFRTESDCEVISHLYEDHGVKVASMLDGMFSFVLLDQNTNSFVVARDPIGITSLYIGWGRDGATWVASEMKCIKDECVRAAAGPPCVEQLARCP
ncbi:asparagine synthase(glutamine-hydrolysing) [Monoraphidium neglectum]|uniref:Asparagine synthase(Glutamine-hydrolysing) n=1 Tax=Monoraphidium neglectum TaxID=145388 RepID=A0A0D2K9Y2_9CHLO|nr:asparagine synthase(glutamine-hydrolysing) [Monoraphidium neglectum]KIY92868.1 asparagine synthase(glutamine-hydrolysing) [Monoraphidium neglectum]|eukprot:XP_013891888.1 asparagine synthase(glutamine-hydrolysing) [Monoraphidium neglectum]